MTEVGMDSDAVRQSAAQLLAAAHSLASIVASTERLIGCLDSVWVGGDAADFVGWWRNKHKPALSQSVAAMEGLAESARRNAEAQDATSGTAHVGGGARSVDTSVQTSVGASGSGQFTPVEGMVVGSAMAFMPGMGLIGAGMSIHNGQVMLNRVDEGLGDTVVDGMGYIPEVGPLIGFSADGAGLFQDLATGQSVLPDVNGLAWDTAGALFPEVDAFKLGLDGGTAISNIPAVHSQLGSYGDWVVANGVSQGGDIGTRYDGPGGILNLIGDSTGLSRIF